MDGNEGKRQSKRSDHMNKKPKENDMQGNDAPFMNKFGLILTF
jgi:hypothetical protein